MQKLSSIEFRRKIHSMGTIEDLKNSGDYIVQFVKNKYRHSSSRALYESKDCVDRFLKGLDEVISSFETPESLAKIKIWILTYIDNPSGVALLGNDPESSLYKFIHFNYTEINMSFNEFYQNYANTINGFLNKNHVSRALNALGINPVMRKIKLATDGGKRKCVMMIQVTREELSEILKKNGLITVS